mgnify:CR=1 FL=1
MKKTLTMSMMLLISVICSAKNTVTTVSQVTGEVTIMDDVDYTITSSTPFTSAGIINIVNTEHAVVIIQNIKPSVVLSNGILSHIQINGDIANDGYNCQVRMYDRGTIIFPYNGTFRPLTTYTEINLQGTAVNNYTEGSAGGYMKNVPTYTNNMISSFVLKRGYMVTFAVGKNGWGYSRCFIADDEDLTINSLPYILNNKITSYRLFKWWNVHKGGLASDAGTASNSALNSGWCYDWGQGNETTLPDREWVPNHIYEDWPSSATCGSRTGACNMKTNNEPGNSSDDHPQDVATVLDNWENLMRTGLRLCSESSHDGSWNHLRAFIDSVDARGWRCDLLDLHCYWPAGSFGDFSNYYNSYGKRPIWISEWTWGASWNNNGIFSAAPDGRDSFSDANQQTMLNGTKPILDKLNASQYVERYAIWNSEAVASKVYHNGQLSLFGEYYSANTGGLGYNASIQKIPVNSRIITKQITTVDASYSTSKGTVTVTWSDNNFERIDSFVVQVKRPGKLLFTDIGTVYPADQDNRDGASTAEYSFIDEEPEIGVSTYKVSARYNNNFITSNESSITLSQNYKIGYLRYGSALISDANDYEVVYAEPFIGSRKYPVLVTSVPSATNKFGKNVNMITETSSSLSKFSLKMFPYIKSNGEANTISTAESIPYLALPKDSTEFYLPSVEDKTKTLLLQAGSQTNVGEESVHVSFNTPYPEGVIPVVIATAQTRSTTSYGVSVRVTDITNTGFNVCLQRQAINSSTFAKVKVYYIALEPGEASLGGGLLLSAQRFNDAITGSTRIGSNSIAMQTPLINPYALFASQSDNYDVMRDIFFSRYTTSTGNDGYTYSTHFNVYAYSDATATSEYSTAYLPSEDIGFIAVATDPNGSEDDEPTVTAIHSLSADAKDKSATFDVWVENGMICSNKCSVRAYTPSGVQVGMGVQLKGGLYIVSDGNSSKKINVK